MRRLLFIDMFRGFAVLVMIEGHVTNSTLLPSIRATNAFHHLDVFHGLIAPSFIFISGFAFALGLERKWENFLRFDRTFWLQLRRLLFVLGLAYWLHLPAWSFQSLLNASRETILWFLRCDILQLIALSLLFSLFLCVTLRNHKLFVWTLFTLTVVIIFITPMVYAIETRNYLPVPISDYMNSRYGALFPLFPWAAFSFAGTFICWVYLRAKDTGKETQLFTILAITGIVFFIGAFALFYVPWQYYDYIDPARSSPRHFMMKMGFIFIMISALWLYEQKVKQERSILNIVGQESLFVYGLHLVLVYGASFTSHHLSYDVGPVLTFRPAMAIAAGLISLMVLCALAWYWLKRHYPPYAKAFFYTLCAIYFIKFFAT